MTPLSALLCFLAPLVGSYVGTKLFEYFDEPIVPSQPKHEPIDPEDPEDENYYLSEYFTILQEPQELELKND